MDAVDAPLAQRGFVTRAEALARGMTDKQLGAEVRAGNLTRFRQGTYASTQQWRSLDAQGRHLLRLSAVMASLGDAVRASHVSSALMNGLDVWGVDLSRVHVTRVDGGAGRHEGDVVHHVGQVDEAADVVVVDGMGCTAPTRAAVEVGLISTPESFLVTADSLLRKGLATHSQLARRYGDMECWPESQKLQLAVRMADGAAGSVGESRLRWLLWGHGIPAPVLQYEVRRPGVDPTCRPFATCDLAWPELGLIIEFDGLVKYGRLLRPGQTPSDAVIAEKLREDGIRECTGFQVIRVTWADLEHPSALVARVRRALGLTAAA
ncbi:type IV toxin-antitoxin system AbiEi family antitoxin domain-containing protein [Nocardioides sp. CFH 31398]|uniref:type IV toxin-antitoxin system AbiEi family antitoxin domain-containing protein n=1 Tax=Nocardioides sp. CFH 31398 TaxID=2919579 RepID=UPI001F05F48C|nr:type IV toxin-antitoxin system AbiEi family antitoxin domain-containing protein [Nocardioides sp. CFH 31398]MCH1868318.1 type IV toxin-antitoxin system AbiEi family antitoxin domain-containing protein [Nocardioides sp. CFH 31398]